mgnify:CR=1 FL=1
MTLYCKIAVPFIFLAINKMSGIRDYKSTKISMFNSTYITGATQILFVSITVEDPVPPVDNQAVTPPLLDALSPLSTSN